MLFKANITPETLQSENALTEQLYIFLNEYVPRRLRYESQEEREDCIQDTVMYLLKRFNGLADGVLQDISIDIEKFFYNRTNSYVSIYIRKLQSERNSRKKYIEHEIYQQKIEQEYAKELEFVDETILNAIIAEYKLEKDNEVLLKEITNIKLKILGYAVPEHKPRHVEKPIFDLLTTLSFAVIDEYLIKSAKTRAES
jgi:hypothetical protein